MNLRPYPEYKDSGVEWYGIIPEKWEITKLKHISQGIYDGDWVEFKDQVENGDYKLIQLKNIANGKIIKKIDKEVTESFFKSANCTKINNNDLLIARIPEPILRSVVFSEEYGNCITVVDVSILTPNNEIDPFYLEYILNSENMRQMAETHLAGSTRQRISRSKISILPVLVPPIIEQKSIVSFLDKKTSEIDKTIEKDTRLIELLQEKKTALINHVVTKGLDPEALMKDSGIEWIGEIPEWWETRRMRYLLKNGIEGIKIGPFGSMIKSEELVENGYKVYGQENVINTDFSRGSRYLTETKFKELINYQIFPEDLVITMMGTTGKAQIVPDDIKEGIMDSHLIRLRFNQNIIPRFAEILINSSSYIFGEIMYFGKGAIMHGLNSGIIKNLILAVPPITEQAEILDYLEKETLKIDKTIQKIQNNISFLQEYKKSLIHHVVTGKVDVREVEA